MRLRYPYGLNKMAVLLMFSTVVLASTSVFAAPSLKAKSPARKASPAAKAVATQPATNSETANLKSSAVSGETSVMASSAAAEDENAVGYSRGELATSAESRFSWRRSDRTKFAYKIGTGFDSFANEREQSQYFGLGFGGDMRIQLAESLNLRIKAGANLSSGYAQSRFGENVGKSGFYFDEAVMSLRLVDTALARFYIAGGALDQGAFDAPLFVSRQAFPGVKQTLVLGSSKEFKIKLWAQQALPTSKNLSTRTVDAEVTPSFLTETAEMTIRPVDSLKLDAAVTHFAFNNLPSAVAQESVVFGNSISEIGPNTARFKYRFDGLLARAGMQIDLSSRFAWTLDGYVIQNTAAPEGYRNGQLIKTGFRIGLPGEIDLFPTVGTYFIEDDAVPGFYNSSEAGHNNRQGFGANLEAFFQRQRFKLKASYNDADVINAKIYQSRQQTLSIGFETFYEML